MIGEKAATIIAKEFGMNWKDNMKDLPHESKSYRNYSVELYLINLN